MRKTLTLPLAALLVLGAAGIVPAQEEAAQVPDLNITYYFKAHPDRLVQFEAALKAHLAAMTELGDPWTWYTWQIITGPRYGEYVINSPRHVWACMDAGAAFHIQRVTTFRLHAVPLLESYYMEIGQALTEFSTWPEDPAYRPKLLEVYEFTFEMGAELEVREMIAQIHAIFGQTEEPFIYTWFFVRSGGEGFRMYMVNAYDSWAAIGELDVIGNQLMLEAIGQEGIVELMQRWSSVLVSFESMILQYRPDLSYTPPE